MSFNAYYAHDKTAQFKHSVISGATATATVWTPTSGKRVIITGVAISSNLGDLVTLKEGTTTGNPDTLFAVDVAGSTTVTPHLGPIELSAADNVLYANADGPGTNGVRITVTGFES